MSLQTVNCLYHEKKKATRWTGHIHIGRVTVISGFCSEKCLQKPSGVSYCTGCNGKRESAFVRGNEL